MANDESVLREVDQELAEEQQWALFRKHGPMIVGSAVAVVIGVAAWQVWTHVKKAEAETNALEYSRALDALADDPVAGREALESLTAKSGGYGALAALQRAGSYAAGGERLKALEEYRQVANGSAPRRLRELAQIRAGYLALADGRDAVIDILGDLPESDSRFSYYAREVMALAALDAEDYETALSNFRELSIDLTAPEGVRTRAEEFAALAAAAKAGVNVTGEARVEDLLKVVGEETELADETDSGDSQASAPAEDVETAPVDDEAGAEGDQDDHAGHDHEE